jgi:hypothetical protein
MPGKEGKDGGMEGRAAHLVFIKEVLPLTWRKNDRGGEGRKVGR